MPRVLIGFAEALPAPEVLFSLRDAGWQVSAFARSARLPLRRLPLEDFHVLPDPGEDAEAAVAALRALMAGPQAPEVLLPLDDAGLWLADAAAGADPRNAGAAGPQAQLALDKRRQVELARAAGLAVPQTLAVERAADLDRLDRFPAILKPAAAAGLQDGRLAKADPLYILDSGGLAQARAALGRAGAGSGPWLAQPLIHGTGEGVFGFAAATGVTAWSAHRRLRMMNPHGSGSSACAAVRPDPALCAAIARFLDAAGWRGAFMMEFLRDSAGVPWFMELNGRMWGSLALARRQGLEYPAWNAALALDPGFAPPAAAAGAAEAAAARGLVQRNLGREILHLMFLLRGPKSAFHREAWPRLGGSLAGVLAPCHPRSFYNYDPRHRSYFLRDAAWTIARALKR